MYIIYTERYVIMLMISIKKDIWKNDEVKEPVDKEKC